jgi:hypothetical protein
MRAIVKFKKNSHKQFQAHTKIFMSKDCVECVLKKHPNDILIHKMKYLKCGIKSIKLWCKVVCPINVN